MTEFCLNLVIERDNPSYQIGKIIESAKLFIEEKLSYKQLRFELVKTFYEIGLIGLKLDISTAIIYFLDYGKYVKDSDITENTRICVHKAFGRSLNIDYS